MPRSRHAQQLTVVPLEVPRLLDGLRLLDGPPYLASVAIINLWRDEALHDKKIAGDFVLISAKSVRMGSLCRLDKESCRDARRFLRPAMVWE